MMLPRDHAVKVIVRRPAAAALLLVASAASAGCRPPAHKPPVRPAQLEAQRPPGHPGPGSPREWDVERACSLSDDGSTQAIRVSTILEGTETACPDNTDCSTGAPHPARLYVNVFCHRFGADTSWDCDAAILNLSHLQQRSIRMLTLQTTRPRVAEFSIPMGAARIGPLYSGADLVVKNMSTSPSLEGALGGHVEVRGAGGLFVNVQVNLRGSCQDAAQHTPAR
jgi:hypothetical protein